MGEIDTFQRDRLMRANVRLIHYAERIAALERENAALQAWQEQARIILADLARYGVGGLMPAEHVAAARALLAGSPSPETEPLAEKEASE